jgi:hypothetical protein
MREWGREFTIGERNWARWIRDQEFGLRANEDRWISRRLRRNDTGNRGDEEQEE